jgi:hypothetical protein
MSEPSTAPDADEAFLLQFQLEYEAAADRPAVVEKYVALRPDLEKRLRSRAAILEALLFAICLAHLRSRRMLQVVARPSFLVFCCGRACGRVDSLLNKK